MKDLRNRVVAITGAASGIGQALAVEFAAHGAHVAVCDLDIERLQTTVEQVQARAPGVEVDAAVVDVADRDAVHDWADAIADRFGRVHVIVNNAGVAVTGTFENIDYDDFEWLMSINFWGVVHGTRAFLPHIRAAGEGHIVNISSVFGIIGHPLQSAYNASKFAVRGMTEALRAELELEGVPIGVTSVHPGGVKTNIARAGRYGDTGAIGKSRDDVIAEFENELARISPAEAARQIIAAVRADERRVVVGHDAKLADMIQRLLPSKYVGLVVRILRHRYL